MKKLTLSRETIRKLDDGKLGKVRGGAPTTNCSGPVMGWTSAVGCCAAGKPDG